MRAAALSFTLPAALSIFSVSAASAGETLPTGGQFAAGGGAISAAGSGLTVNQASSHAIINWQTFSIGNGNNVRINNGSGATLNRVTTENPSIIAGSLTATGSVYLINQNGIIVTPTGKVATGGSFIGSTRDTSDSAFMQGGAAQFTGTSSGAIVNQGSIKAANGDAVLIGKSVANSGAISAPNGTTALAAGDDVVLQPSGSGLQIKVNAGSGDVTNTGTVEAAQAQLNAAGGNVYALAGNNGGVVRATGIANINGHVWLSAGGNTIINGAVSARNADGSGGAITATGTNITVGGGLDASATTDTAPGGSVGVEATGNTKATGTITLTSNGAVTASGAMKAGGLDLEGSGGDYALTNAGNAVTTLAANTGNVNYVQAGDLSIGTVGSTAGVTAAGTVWIATNSGNLTVANGAAVTAGGSGNALVLKAGAASLQPDATGGDFINDAGGAALGTPNGNWLVYTGHRAGEGTVDGGLDYIARFDADAGGVPPAGDNYFLFRSDPIYVTASLTGTVVKTYDGTLLATLDAANYDLSGVAAADRGSVSLTVNGAAITNPTSGAFSTKDVGSGLPVTVSGLGLNESSSSPYVLSATAITGNIGAITPATLTYVADPGRRTYGADNPVLTGNVTGFVPGENLASATTGVAVFTSTATASSNIGAYAVTGSGLTANNGDYVFVQAIHNKSALTVRKAVLTYTAIPVSRTYGAANPAFAGTVTGFVLGQTMGTATSGTLAFTATATESSNAGNYKITGAGLAATNYAFVQSAGNATALTINPATLAYVADPASRTYGASNPAFTGTVTGFVLGQTLATATTGTLDFITPASPSSNAGSYAIKGIGLVANKGNYAFTQAAGNGTALTVKKATLTYTAAPVSRTYGADNPGLTGTVTGFVLGQTLATATTGTLSFTATATAASNVGSYRITGAGLAANNYAFAQAASNAAALTISPATLTYAADPVSRTYGALNPVFTGTVTGFVLGQTLATATAGTINFTTPASPSANIGDYAIRGSGLTANNGNYVFAQAAGNSAALTVTPATLVYTATPASRTYGASDPDFRGTVTGFVLGQTLGTATTGTLSFTGGATESSDAGSYAVTGSGLSAGNYVFVQAAGNATALSVAPAKLTYVADQVSVTYGADNPALTGTVTGFVLGQTQATATTGTLSFTSAATSLSDLGSYPVTGSGLTANRGNYVFVQAHNNAFAMTILTNHQQPGGPALLGQITNATLPGLLGAYDVYVSGTTAFVTTQQHGSLIALDVSNPANPTFISESPRHFATDNRVIAMDGNYAFVSNPSHNAILVYDISNPANIIEAGSLISAADLAGVTGITRDGNTLYASAIKSNDLVSIDISNPTAPTIIGALPITSAQNVKIYTPGATAVVSSQLGGAVYSVNISNPAAMSVLSSVTGIAGADQILTDSNTGLAYVSTRVVYPSEFYTFSVGGNGALSLVNTTPNLGGATILRKGDDLFLPGPLFNYNDKHSSLNIASIADPTAPTQTYIGPADLVEARGTFIDPANPGILYLTNDSGNGFQIYDISQIP